MRKSLLVIAAVFAAPLPGRADTADASCEIYPKGEDHASEVVACSFSQRQGHVGITLEDGRRYDLSPVGDAPGNYRDEDGRRVYRNSGLGDQGQIYRFPEQSIYVYWKSADQDASSGDNWTAPFSTDEYDATTRLPCRAANESSFGSCPAGILRMEGGQASIVVQSPAKETFTINFMSDYVNATGREIKATLDGDTWTVVVSNGEVYEVPLAAIEGG